MQRVQLCFYLLAEVFVLDLKRHSFGSDQGNKHIVMAEGSRPEIQRSQQAAEPGKLTFLAASPAWGAEQQQTVT